MRLDVNGRTVHVSFKHWKPVAPGETPDEAYPAEAFSPETARVTQCFIEDGTARHTGYARCHVNDQFSKAKGRAKSFARAMGTTLVLPRYDRAARKQLWEAYWLAIYDAQSKTMPGVAEVVAQLVSHRA